MPIAIPGGKLAVEHWNDWPRAMYDAAILLELRGRRLASRAGRLDPPEARRAERAWARRVLAALRVDLRLEGLANIDSDRPHVVAPLHEGFADPAVLLQLPLELRFVARRELTDWPLLGRYLEAGSHVLVEPEQQHRSMKVLLRAARNAVDAGESLVVFPQASMLGVEAAFRPGYAAIAKRAGMDVLPVVLAGTHRVWEWPYSPVVRYGRPVFMKVLPPVAATATSGLERAMKDLALANGHAPVRRFDPDRDGYWDGYAFEIDPRFDEVARKVAAHRSGEGGAA